MVKIAPSILSADFANLERDCRKVLAPGFDMLHFDVMDGVFVPNISVGLPVLKSLKKAIPDAVYDAHLMIIEPDHYIEDFARAGADYITIHLESNILIGRTLDEIRALGCKAGLSLRPGTPIEGVYPYLKQADMVLVMSVEPGFGGQSFMPEAPGRISALCAEARRQNTPLLIEVDGGIDVTTAPLCAKAGVDILVAGSSVFGAADPLQAAKNLAQAAQDAQ